MHRPIKFVSAACFISLIGDVAFAERTNASVQLLVPLNSLFFLATIVFSVMRAFSLWRKFKLLALLPLVLCVLTFIISIPIRRAIRAYAFEKALPGYEVLIRQIETGGIPVSTNFQHLPKAETAAVYRVFAYRDTNGALTVEFWTGGGFPVVHSGYLYSSSDVVERDSIAGSRWPLRGRIKPKWFAICD